MTVGRKATKAPKTTPVEEIIDTPRFANAMTVMQEGARALSLEESQHQAHVRAVATQVGYQLPGDCVDPDLIQRDIAINMRRSVEACLEVGRGLSVLKQACEHGGFIARLDVLGIEQSVARRFMTAAVKFSNRASTHVLKAAGNQTKLFELLVLDEDQIEELALTGETGDLKLDDVASMSVKELRAAVRELRNDKAANEKLIAHKSKQLDEAALVKLAPPDERLELLRKEATASMNDTRGALIGRFSAAIEAVDAHYRDQGVDADIAFLAGLTGQLQADLTALRDRLGIPDVTPALIPEWVTDPAFGKSKRSGD